MVNRYEISEADQAFNPVRLMALAEQKRMAFKEQVTFFSDVGKSRPVFGFKARKVMDLGSGYDITDEAGQQIGFFRKDFGASPAPLDLPPRGAGLRRHRPGAQPAGRPSPPLHRHPVPADPLRLRRRARASRCSRSSGKMSIGDRYNVTVPDRRVDFRVAAADRGRTRRPDGPLSRLACIPRSVPPSRPTHDARLPCRRLRPGGVPRAGPSLQPRAAA